MIAQQIEQEYQADNQLFLTKYHQKYQDLQLKIQQEQSKQYIDHGNSQNRSNKNRLLHYTIKAIQSNPNQKGNKKKGGEGGIESGYGDNADDWDIYRKLDQANVHHQSDDSDHEQLQEQLNKIENILKKYHPNYFIQLKKQQDLLKQIQHDNLSLLSTYGYLSKKDYHAGLYQFIIHVELLISCEALYQPKAICGINQAGLTENISRLLYRYKHQSNIIPSLLDNIYISGTNTLIKNFTSRLYHEINSITQVNITPNIVNNTMEPFDYHIDITSWQGAAMFVQHAIDNNHDIFINRDQFFKNIHPIGYFKQHQCSNIFHEIPQNPQEK